jgi:hypothetical protein
MLSQLYKVFYRRWNRPPAHPKRGYSLWILMPGDLPFFFDIFLAVFAAKKTEHLVETIIVADESSPELNRRFERFAEVWPHGAVRMVRLRPLDRLLIKLMKRHPHLMCWLQFVNAVRETRSTHALWHDADLFMLDNDFFDAHYEECVRRNLAFMGLSPVWDRWFAEVGLPNINATWEMMFEVATLRKFMPWQHRGHNALVLGQEHVVDITLLAQAETPQERVGRRAEEPDFVHFSYVICSYRAFQNGRARYEDDYFRILLIRLLIDALDSDSAGWNYDAPTVDELVLGLTDPSARVTYTGPETAGHYEEFRLKLQRLIDSPLLNSRQSGRIVEGIARFDQFFGHPAGLSGVAVAD